MRPPLPFPECVTEIHGRVLPEAAVPVGYAALIAAYGLLTVLPRTLSAVGIRHRKSITAGWRILTPRHAPPATLEGHLTFALKYEGLDLAVLNALFHVLDPAAIECLVRAKPTGRYIRRLWFLYEGLTGQVLNLPPLKRGSYVDALDADFQYDGRAVNSPRHRVRNNLPGPLSFCPLVFRTQELDEFCSLPLSARAAEIIGSVSPQGAPILMGLLAMGEIQPPGAPLPPLAFAQKWIESHQRSRTQTLSLAGLQDVAGEVTDAALLQEMQSFSDKCGALHPVIEASCLAFGFAGVTGANPLDAGYRFVIQHTLTRRRLASGDYALPVSMAMLHRIDTLRSMISSGGALFDATPHAEFLARCTKHMIETGVAGAVHCAEHACRFAEAAEKQVGIESDKAMRVFDKLSGNNGRVPAIFAKRCRKGPEFHRTLEELFKATADVTIV